MVAWGELRLQQESFFLRDCSTAEESSNLYRLCGLVYLLESTKTRTEQALPIHGLAS
jgi:hypothetical protein